MFRWRFDKTRFGRDDLANMGELIDKRKQRTGYAALDAVDYRDGGNWDILVSPRLIERAKKRGPTAIRELTELVPFTLIHPTAIFSGIRFDEYEDLQDGAEGWLCYVAVPEVSFNRYGVEMPPYPNEVYLVFANAERVAYYHTWERCSPQNPRLPIDFETRFKKQVL